MKKGESFINRFNSMFSMLGKGEKGEKCQKILLIDEIDVLFNPNYYGDTFNLAINLSDHTIIELFEFIWKNKDSTLDYERIKDSK